MPKGPPLERWDMCMKVDLKKSKDNSRSPSSLKSIKESWQGEGKIEGWKAYKVETISKQALSQRKPRLGLKGQRPSRHTHTLWHALKPNFAQVAKWGGSKKRIQREHGWQRTSFQNSHKHLWLKKMLYLQLLPISRQKQPKSSSSLLMPNRAILNECSLILLSL